MSQASEENMSQPSTIVVDCPGVVLAGVPASVVVPVCGVVESLLAQSSTSTPPAGPDTQ